MPRVTCGKCSRNLEYSGGDPPLFCAYCGQSLTGPSTSESTEGWSNPPPSPAPREPAPVRMEETADYIPISDLRTIVPAPGSRITGELPERVKGYRLIRQLGRGGMGTVYEAEDSRHGRKVAIKIIAPGYVESESAVERFRQEGRLASSLAHPRCVFVLEADEGEDGRPFIAMELMTGDTLQDLVEKGGPLAIGDAVAKILDVIDGLREAHRLGLMHRDVKPSNCFLDGDGRVKVGDFGLSKAQVGSAHLTRTGSFLGTPLYASPEQIKVETLDARTDIYSTAATLFFLLTGRAPFDRGDASATMARIVTEPAPSAREKRPEVPIGLDRAIRKGLDRDVDRRYQTLDDFRLALLPFVPGHVPAAPISLRIAVYLVDYAVCFGILVAILYSVTSPTANVLVDLVFLMAYFTLSDGIWGGTPAKQLMGLRVVQAEGRESIGVARAALRTAVFLTLAELPIVLSQYGPWVPWPAIWSSVCVLLAILGLVPLAWPIVAKKDKRGLHDLIARSRVVMLPRDERRRSASTRRPIGRDRGSVSRPVGVMKAVGPYKIRGAIRWEPNRRVVAGEDSTLGREAWIVIRPKGSLAPGPARREVSRATRPRWLAGGDQAEGHWDAYVAPNGCPLADFAGPDGLPWRDARLILEDLTDELAAACAEGTLPPGLTVDQVWVQPDGRAILVDPLAIADSSETSNALTPDAENERALSLLRRVAALALEGGRYRTDAVPKSIRSPMPLHASAMLKRLLGEPNAFHDVAAFRAELDATRNLPTEVTRGHRAMNLVFLSLALVFGLLWSYYWLDAILSGDLDPKAVDGPQLDPAYIASARLEYAFVFAGLFPAIWIVWDLLTRGGLALRFAGFGLVLGDGRLAPRWRCGWRSLVTWAPLAVLLIASVWLDNNYPNPRWVHRAPFYLALALPILYAVQVLILPARGLHDRLSGLRVVPR
jgi:eukaryotic-like serine/threonine-protein kinase